MKRVDLYCTECGHELIDQEVETDFTDDDRIDCPKCGKKNCVKINFGSFSGSFDITNDFQAVPRSKGANWAKQKFQRYSGLRDPNSTSKRFYKGGSLKK